MQAKDCMSKKAEFLPPTATLKEAAKWMLSHDYGFVPVGENDRLVGAVTDRDITVRAVAEGKDPNKTQLKDIMTSGITYCFETDDLKDVASKMKSGKIRRLVVLNDKKRLTGVISLGDIAVKGKDAAICKDITDAVAHH